MKNIFFLQNKYYEILIFMCFIIQKGIFKVYSSIHRHAQTQTDTDTHTETHTHTHTQTHTHTHTHTPLYMYTHTSTHIHTHTHTPVFEIQCFEHAVVQEREHFRYIKREKRKKYSVLPTRFCGGASAIPLAKKEEKNSVL